MIGDAGPAANEDLEVGKPGAEALAQIPGVRQPARRGRHEAKQVRSLIGNSIEQFGREEIGRAHV